MWVDFYTTQREPAGFVGIRFTTTPRYYLGYCSISFTNFPTNLPSREDKIWRITLTRTAGIRVKIHCNGVEVLNLLLSDSTCGNSVWRNFWSKDVEQIYFDPNWNEAPDYYRAVQPCMIKNNTLKLVDYNKILR